MELDLKLKFCSQSRDLCFGISEAKRVFFMALQKAVEIYGVDNVHIVDGTSFKVTEDLEDVLLVRREDFRIETLKAPGFGTPELEEFFEVMNQRSRTLFRAR